METAPQVFYEKAINAYKFFKNIEKIKKHLKKKNGCAIFRIGMRGNGERKGCFFLWLLGLSPSGWLNVRKNAYNASEIS